MVKGQREKMYCIMGRWGIRGLETRVGRESSVSRDEARLHSGGIHVGGGSHSDSAGGAALRVRAAKSSELGQGKLWAPEVDPFGASAALH